MAELHETHDWTVRGGVPICRDCKAEGYEDEPDGFLPCPGPPERKGKKPCPATMESRDDPGHTHRCSGGHTEGDHFCGGCSRWFGVAS